MNPAATRFNLDEEISFSGKPMRVAGFILYEGANAQVSTRYLLTEPAGAPVILEESGGQFAVLRPFLPTAQPQATGSTVSVMGKKYTLAGVRKLKVLGAAGQVPGGTPKTALVLSGLFEGEMGTLVRELPPGTGTHVFYSLKPVHVDEVLTGAQRTARLEAERRAAQARADDEEDTAAGPGPLIKAAIWISMALIVAGLGFACSRSDTDQSPPTRASGFTSDRR